MELQQDRIIGLGPDPLALLEPRVELPPLTGALADSGGGQAEDRSGLFDLSPELVSECVHAYGFNVMDHIGQARNEKFHRKTSHSLLDFPGFITWRMSALDYNETFRLNLMAKRQEADISAAELSRKAGLNDRAVKDIEERRSQSPKLSTVFALADALGVDAGELIGLPPRPRLVGELVAFLEQLDIDQQERLLNVLEATPARRSE